MQPARMAPSPPVTSPVAAPSDARVRAAARTLREAGLVVLEDVFDRAYIDALRREYDARLERHIADRGGLDVLNAKTFGKNQIGMHLPLVPPFSDEQIVAHPLAVAVMEEALGAEFACSFYHSNTAYPGSEVQPVHRDHGPLFGPGEMSVPTPATHLVLNVPLCDFSEENGSTEVWPGTHLVVDRAPEDRSDLEARVHALPSIRTNVRAGSLILRDLRVWHRGMPNRAGYARPMLALVYARGWLVQEPPLSIPQATWDGWSERTRRIFRRNTVVVPAQ